MTRSAAVGQQQQTAVAGHKSIHRYSIFPLFYWKGTELRTFRPA